MPLVCVQPQICILKVSILYSSISITIISIPFSELLYLLGASYAPMFAGSSLTMTLRIWI